MKKENIAKLLYILSIILYGTTGCFYRFIDLPAGLFSLLRALICVIFIIIFVVIIRKKPNYEMIKKNLLWLFLGGTSIGFNWICLFEAYNNTTVATASLINYLAPALFIVVAPIILKEKFPPYKIIFVFTALIGVILVSGFFNDTNNGSIKGVILAIFASIGYLGILIFNKKQNGVEPFDKVIIELLSASIVIAPYAIIKTDFSAITFDYKLILYVLGFGIFLTALAYILYLGSMEHMASLHIAILSYIEPVTSVILSIVILKENLSIYGIIGGVLILSSTILCEVINDKKTNKIDQIDNNTEL
ncbi:MAG: DMT family transporter [Bacilli bacterium]|nr:DMT family transporter [Bacilli bacterium]